MPINMRDVMCHNMFDKIHTEFICSMNLTDTKWGKIFIS